MKCLLAAATLFLGTAAQAQSTWEGPYAGGSFNLMSGTNTYGDVADFPLEGTMFGGFAGYNLPMSGYVLGGEVSFLSGTTYEEEYEDEFEYTSFIDLKGRVGFESGAALPFIALGASFTNLLVDATDEDPTYDFEQSATGLFVSIGIDYQISEQFFVGSELASRSFKFEFDDGINLADMDGSVTSLAVRGALKF